MPRPARSHDNRARRRWVQRVAAFQQGLAARAAVPLRALGGSRGENAFGILMYHRVTPVIAGFPAPTWNVTPAKFRRQIAGLIALGYQPWPLERAIASSGAGISIPRNAFVVTFDDGYANNYSEAWPILRELAVPATIFLATSFLDTQEPFPFDGWPGAGAAAVPATSWKPLSTAQCAEMSAGGLMGFGSHTHSHGDFRGRPDELFEEIRTSAGVLRAALGLTDVPFAFPYGTRRTGFSGPLLADAARRAGVTCGLTTEEDLVAAGSDPFDWGRFTVRQSDTPRTLAAKLDGWYTRVRDCWRTVRG
jgi:peptidoglycan/xylan/chitin deacetylase (PgdA/CDA1 family)